MIHFFIRYESGKGYIVMMMDNDNIPSVAPVRCFGYRQTDAIEFRNDCNSGRIDESRIRLLVKTYSDIPYKYLGNGNLRKQRREVHE